MHTLACSNDIPVHVVLVPCILHANFLKVYMEMLQYRTLIHTYIYIPVIDNRIRGCSKEPKMSDKSCNNKNNTYPKQIENTLAVKAMHDT